MSKLHHCRPSVEVFSNLTRSDVMKFHRDSTSSSNNQSGSPKNLALKNLTISIQAREKVAICGRSGRLVSPVLYF